MKKEEETNIENENIKSTFSVKCLRNQVMIKLNFNRNIKKHLLITFKLFWVLMREKF